MTEVTVGIDIGTTSVKALAADGDGNVVARARVPHPLSVPTGDAMEHDANRAWRRGPRRALAALGDVRPRGLCVAAMVPSVTAVDRRGIPRTPGLLYGDARGRTGGDKSASPISGELEAFVGWSAKQLPDARGYWPAQAVTNHVLAGEAVLDTGAASSGFPLFNGHGWDADRAGAIGVDVAQLPRVEPTGQAVGRMGDAVLASGSVDALAEQIVAGADEDGDVLVICGTTLITWIVMREWRQAPGLWTIPHTTPGMLMMGGPSGSGGLFLNWANRLVGRADRSEAPADPYRVPVWTPYPHGERTPLHDPDRRAGLHELDLTHDVAALRRAAVEAAGFVVRHHIDLGGVPVRRIVATGGGTRDRAWIQALADCTALPVDVVAVPEGGALGAAFLARVAAGMESSTDDAARWARTSHRVEPDAHWVGPAGERYEVFRQRSGGPPDEGGPA
jgi:xylulokinase